MELQQSSEFSFAMRVRFAKINSWCCLRFLRTLAAQWTRDARPSPPKFIFRLVARHRGRCDSQGGTMRTRRVAGPVVLIPVALLCLPVTVPAQDVSNGSTPQNAVQPSAGEEHPDIIELDVFGGVSMFGEVKNGLGEKLITGGVAGGRAAWNFSQHLGLELSYNFMVNNVRLVTPIAPGLPSYNFGQQIYYPALNLVYNFTRRGSRFQPYVTVGGGAAQFTPTSKAQAYARDPAVNAIYGSAGLNDNLQPALNYGGGIKFHLSEHLDFDSTLAASGREIQPSVCLIIRRGASTFLVSRI